VAALRVLAVMLDEGRPLSELIGGAMVRYPQVLVNFAVAHKRPLDELPDVCRTISQVEMALGAEGRVVVRYSGTEAKARVMIEGTNETLIRAHANDIAQAIQQALA
jgi:phosphoglucosamine mutase